MDAACACGVRRSHAVSDFSSSQVQALLGSGRYVSVIYFIGWTGSGLPAWKVLFYLSFTIYVAAQKRALIPRTPWRSKGGCRLIMVHLWSPKVQGRPLMVCLWGRTICACIHLLSKLWLGKQGLAMGKCSANLGDKNRQTHIEMFEMSSRQFPPFSKNQARNSW